MKVSFLSAMTKRVEVVHTQAQTIEKLEQKIKDKDLIINELKV
jgi:hypothetical protein